MIEINRDQCIRCGSCIKDCIVEVLKAGENGVPFMPPELERYCLNCQHCLAVCPAEAVTCNGFSAEKCSAPGELPEPETMFNLLRQRRSIRQYKDENISPEIMQKLKDSLAWMPTGCNDHSLTFHIVEDKEQMKFFSREMSRMLKFLIRTGIMRLIYPNYKRYLQEILNDKDVIFRNAPHMIIAAVPKTAPCKEADPWIALSYLDLFMQSYGIGTCWCGFAMHAFRFNRRMRSQLGIPQGYKIGGVLLFGKPAVTYCRTTAPENFKITKVN